MASMILGGLAGRTNVIGALMKSILIAAGLISCSVDTDIFTGWTEPIELPRKKCYRGG